MHHEHSRLTKQALYHIRFRAGLLILKTQPSVLITQSSVLCIDSVLSPFYRLSPKFIQSAYKSLSYLVTKDPKGKDT
jgi:hypothetical protein